MTFLGLVPWSSKPNQVHAMRHRFAFTEHLVVLVLHYLGSIRD